MRGDIVFEHAAYLTVPRMWNFFTDMGNQRFALETSESVWSTKCFNAIVPLYNDKLLVFCTKCCTGWCELYPETYSHSNKLPSRSGFVSNIKEKCAEQVIFKAGLC